MCHVFAEMFQGVQQGPAGGDRIRRRARTPGGCAHGPPVDGPIGAQDGPALVGEGVETSSSWVASPASVRNSASRSRSGSGAPTATLSQVRLLVMACTARIAIEFVSSPAGRQFNASVDAPSIAGRMSSTHRSNM